MAYEVINKELMMEACNIGDLKLDQVEAFLQLWGDDSPISTLTLFMKDDGTVILNKDNPKYELYKNMTYNYLKGTEEDRARIKKEFTRRIQRNF